MLPSGWVGRLAGHRGPLMSHVAPADTSVEQTLRPIILGPTSILLSWNLVPEARGYRLEWRRESGPCRRPGWAGGVEAWPRLA